MNMWGPQPKHIIPQYISIQYKNNTKFKYTNQFYDTLGH